MKFGRECPVERLRILKNHNFTISPLSKFQSANLSIIEFETKRVSCAQLFRQINLTHLESDRKIRKLSYLSYIVQAVTESMVKFPYLNQRIFPGILSDKIVKFKNIDISIAVERIGEGSEATAFCDTIRETSNKTIYEIDSQIKKLRNATVNNNLQWRQFSLLVKYTPKWLTKLILRLPHFFPRFWIKYRGGALLISSPAKYGVDQISASWIWPIGISYGFVELRPMQKDNKIILVPSTILTMSFDRRFIAGAQASIFFSEVCKRLENYNLIDEI